MLVTAEAYRNQHGCKGGVRGEGELERNRDTEREKIRSEKAVENLKNLRIILNFLTSVNEYGILSLSLSLSNPRFVPMKMGWL